jgi:hypothetical protein
MSVSLVNIAVIAGTLALVLGITVLAMRIVRWRRDVALRRHGVPMLVMPMDDAGGAPRPVLTREAATEVPSSTATHFADAATQPRGMAAIPETPPDEDQPTISTGPFRPGEVRPGSPSAHLVLGSQVRFFRAEEGTLEFLPGRLEIVGGEDVGQEIHFARQMGTAEPTTITFGRAEGAPLRHIQLLDPTVSRQHAQMTWDGSTWRLANQSSTNPVVFNGTALGINDDTLILSDGDRFEMGAVVFVFHVR